MAYDEALAARIRQALDEWSGVAEKKMFGGVAFMLHGKMFCGVVKDDLMVRVGPEQHESSLAQPHVRPMDFTGRPMKGFLYVAPAGTRTVKEVAKWIQRGADFAASLEGEKPKRARKRKAARR